MRRKAFPVLDGAEDALVEELRVGLAEQPARVLAYLVARATADESVDASASKLAIRVGTGLGRTATDEALNELERRGLVSRATRDRRSSGRPVTEWRVAADEAATRARIHETHADDLLEQAVRIADAFDVSSGRPATRGGSGVTVALNWDPNGFHAPLFVAARGPYADRGLDVSFASCRGSRAALERLTSGDADVALAGAASILRAQEKRTAVVPLALLYQRAATALYTTRDVFGGDFESVEQLRGRRIATPAGSETDVLCRLFLSQAGVIEDVTIVEATGEERHALLDGPADVVTGMATDVLDLRTAGYTVDAVLVADHFPAYGPALAVPERALRDRAALLAEFLRGTMAGWTAVKRDPASAAETVAERSERDPERERGRLEMALDHFAGDDGVRKHGWGWQSVDGWQRLRTALEQANVVADAT